MKLIVWTAGALLLLRLGFPGIPTHGGDKSLPLRVGFGEVDVTPAVGKEHKPVWLAGFGKGRAAVSVHDPIMARAIVLAHGERKIAIVAVDLVGLFLPTVERVRKELPGMAYVLVSSTHNHEGPDTMGLWGPNLFQSGVDPDYMKKVEAGIVAAVRKADQALVPVKARIGKAQAPDLLADNREPYIKHDELVALEFQDASSKTVGLLVQWNCHPETLSSKNTEVSADFVAGTVAYLKERRKCPVVYLTGTVGGLMTSLGVKVVDDQGKPLADGTFAKTEKYGRLVGELAEKALSKGQAVTLTPFTIRKTDVFLPLDNPFFLLGWRLGVLERDAYLWKGGNVKPERVVDKKKIGPKERACMRTELAWLRLGDLDVAVIPGEIYPELVLGKVQDPPDPGADFPDAPMEPGIYAQLKGPHRMIVGLGNDEVGYIIPKRQWDEKPPFCYGRKKTQYGEVNSLGPDTAPILCRAFQEMAKK